MANKFKFNPFTETFDIAFEDLSGKVKFFDMDSTFDVVTWKGDLLFKFRKADNAILFEADIYDNMFSS